MTALVDWTHSLVDQMTEPSDPVWEEDPVDLETFVRSERHLGLPPLSKNQMIDLIKLFGTDPKKVFAGGSPVNVGVLLWGKGGGKDYCAAIGQNYANHILHCMRNPHLYFGLAERQFIDLINTAPNAKNAVAIYYEFFEQMLLNWPWMRERYTFLNERGRLMELDGNKKGLMPLVIAGHDIEFKLKKVRTITRGSDANVSEGFAPIYWCMDEASGMRDHTETMNADKLYRTLRTSAKTRYGLNWKGLIISYPREKHDFTVRMYDLAMEKGKDDTNATMFGSKRCTWEALPPERYSKEKFDFEGILGIPETFREEFEDTPEVAKMMLACIPPEVEAAFFQYPNRVLECVHPNRAPLFTTEDIEVTHQLKDGTIKHYTGKKILSFHDRSMASRKIPRVIHVDGGLTKDHATLTLAHGEPIEIRVKDDEGKVTSTYRYKTITDVVLRWRPDKKKQLQVSLNNVESMIIQIAEVYNVVKVSYDQWNSQSSLEMLQAKNITAQEHTINDKDYNELRSMVYQGAVDLLPHVYELDGRIYENKDAGLLYHELITLKNINGRVNHPKDSSKDGADGLAGVNRLLNNPKEQSEVRRRMPRSIIGPAFTRATAMPFSPAQAGIVTPIPDGFGIPKSATPMTGQAAAGPVMSPLIRSSRSNDGMVPDEAAVKGYGSKMPRSVLSTSNSGRMSTTRNMSRMMNNSRLDIPQYHMK